MRHLSNESTRTAGIAGGCCPNAKSGSKSLGRVRKATGALLDRLLPEKQIGLLFPVNVIDTTPYEFYSMIPKGIMLVTVPLGLKV